MQSSCLHDKAEANTDHAKVVKFSNLHKIGKNYK